MSRWSLYSAGGVPITQGLQGIVGPAGAQGPIGNTGAVGAQGPIGNTGAAGAAGAQGPIGNTGAAGAVGAQGPIGNTGAAGAAGAQGPIGNIGAAGAVGAQGPIGNAGAAGAVGAQGIQGNVGPQGPAATRVIESATITLPNQSQFHEQTVARVGTLSTQSCHVWLAPTIDADDNSIEFLERYNIDAVCEAGQLRFFWRSELFESGSIKLKYEVI